MFTGNLSKEGAPQAMNPVVENSPAAALVEQKQRHQENIAQDERELAQVRQTIDQAVLSEEQSVAGARAEQDNSAELAKANQELQKAYLEKAAAQEVATISPEARNETVVVVANNLKQEIDTQKVMQQNLHGDPAEAKTFRAVLSEKIRKIIDLVLRNDKKELVNQANQEKKA